MNKTLLSVAELACAAAAGGLISECVAACLSLASEIYKIVEQAKYNKQVSQCLKARIEMMQPLLAQLSERLSASKQSTVAAPLAAVVQRVWALYQNALERLKRWTGPSGSKVQGLLRKLQSGQIKDELAELDSQLSGAANDLAQLLTTAIFLNQLDERMHMQKASEMLQSLKASDTAQKAAVRAQLSELQRDMQLMLGSQEALTAAVHELRDLILKGVVGKHDSNVLQLCVLNRIKKQQLDASCKEAMRAELAQKGLMLNAGQLTVKGQIGQGGFSSVFAGVLHGEEVAIKRATPASWDQQALDYLEEDILYEAYMISRLNHPRIARLYGVVLDREQRLWGLVLHKYQYTLDRLLIEASRQGDTLDMATQLDLAFQIARGVKFLHDRQIVHADLKPSNVLVEQLNKRWQCVISDFGVAAFKPDTKSVTSTTTATGAAAAQMARSSAMTLRFSPPEVLAAPMRRRRPPADIYALGMLLYELFTGCPAFATVPDEQFKALVTQGGRPEFDDYAEPPVPEGVQACIQACWQQDASQRPHAAAVVEMLEGCLQAEAAAVGGQPAPMKQPANPTCMPATSRNMPADGQGGQHYPTMPALGAAFSFQKPTPTFYQGGSNTSEAAFSNTKVKHQETLAKTNVASLVKLLATGTPEQCERIVAEGAVQPLVQLLTDGTPDAMAEAAAALATLAAGHADCCAQILAAGAVAPLAKLLAKGDQTARESAASVLASLADGNGAACEIIMRNTGVVAQLVQLLTDGTPVGQKRAVVALHSLAVGCASGCQCIGMAGAVGPLVALLSQGSPDAKGNAAGLLAHLAADNNATKGSIMAAGAVGPLVKLLTDGTPCAKEGAARLLGHLASLDDERADNIITAGAVAPLVQLLADGTPKAKEHAAWALSMLAKGSGERFKQFMKAAAVTPLAQLLKGGLLLLLKNPKG